MVSDFQNGVEGKGGCGRNCLGKSCLLQGAKLPLFTFTKRGLKKLKANIKGTEKKFLDTLLLTEWKDRVERSLFLYNVTDCETKMIPGDYGFIAQLNENRHLKKRPTEFPRVGHVLQPFDVNKFNFTKVRQDEVLFRFEESTENMEATFFQSISIQPGDSPSIVVINVSPIEYGHVLLIPKVLECLPQRIDKESFLLALHLAAAVGNPYFRVGYSSLGAFATINHLHFQAYYLAMPFPVEKAATRLITSVERTGTKIYQFVNYPVRGLIFEDDNSLEDLSDAVSEACIFLQSNNIPYNVLISYCGKRVFLYPQCYAEKKALGEVSQDLLDTQVNPGVWEISGHMLLKRKKDYEEASEEKSWRLLAGVSLSEERFQEVKSYILEAVSALEELIAADGEQIIDF